MGAKRKKSRQQKHQVEAQLAVTGDRRSEELRALFPQTPSQNLPSAVPSHTVTLATPTPTPTIPTQATDSRATSVTRALEKTTSTSVMQPYGSPERREQPLRTVIAKSPYSPAKRVDLGKAEREKETPWWLGPALIAGAVFMLFIGWLHIDRAKLVDKPVGHTTSTLEAVNREAQKELQRKVDFYRSQVGHRLNRDRVNMEIMNARLAPEIETSAVPQTDTSMMRGAPLMQEKYVEQNYGPKNKIDPVPIDNPDARVMYSLQEEQYRDEYDRRVQKEYIREFLENARRDGVNVKLDEDNNVIAVEPIPGTQLNPNTRRPGSYEPGVSK